LRETIHGIIEADGYDGKYPWLFKDAKITLIWPVYQDAFPAARWVIVRRNVSDIISSCLNTPFMRQHSGNPALWRSWAEEYLARLEMLKNTCAACTEIWPQELIDGNPEPLRDLVADLGLQWNGSGVNGFIDSSCWHAFYRPSAGGQGD
jgi:hypothetical protein